MVFDRLENAASYAALHARLPAAFDWLRGRDLCNVPLGRHDIDGDALFALVQEYQTKPRSEGFWESHRKYIDVQCVVAGVEQIGYANIATLSAAQAYDPQRDLCIWDGSGDFLTVAAGMVAIFAPQDAHMPCLALETPATVRKIVVKVAV